MRQERFCPHDIHPLLSPKRHFDAITILIQLNENDIQSYVEMFIENDFHFMSHARSLENIDIIY